MNFFRSEEHLRRWADFDPATLPGMVPLADLMTVFSADFFRRRPDPDYFSKMRQYGAGFVAALKQVGKTGAFWVP